ncbi:AAA family ATPase [Reinekea sp.]|jgi:MoxR-like ATPase|uniref:AAA family ATPase n=1 Tax=Reinekea sp. TaxID=1970455 RepID=UPI003988E0B1
MDAQNAINQLKQSLVTRIIGQEELVESLILCLLADGHLLVEGAPGLAKTTAIKTLADSIHGDFQRIQFTPDLMPSDVTGSDIYRVEEHRFEFQAGPIFANLVLADEINRAPAKVQSALLEAMSEKQVSVNGTTHPLPNPFLVMATQNPVENEGTYPLPEAQLDRFIMKVNLDYPSIENEQKILRLARAEQAHQLPELTSLDLDLLLQAREALNDIHVSDAVEQYILHLVHATREPELYSPALASTIDYGASPRATIALERLARGLAWLEGSEFVTPDHVQRVASRVLAHRIVISLNAQASGRDAYAIIYELLQSVAIA